MILYAHAGIRYLIFIAGIAAIVYAVRGLIRKRPYDKNMGALAFTFTALIYLQILLGVGVLFTGRFYPALGGHVLLMAFAAVAAQLVPSVMRRRPVASRGYGPYIVGTAIALALIVTGILAVPGAAVIG
jgi:hypothetical protein